MKNMFLVLVVGLSQYASGMSCVDAGNLVNPVTYDVGFYSGVIFRRALDISNLSTVELNTVLANLNKVVEENKTVWPPAYYPKDQEIKFNTDINLLYKALGCEK